MKYYTNPSLKSSLLISLVLIFLSSLCYSQNNVATGKVYDASNYVLGNPPENAFDEILNSNWNAGGPPVQWISVDLLGNYDIYSIRLTVSQSPNGNTTHSIYKTSDNINWTLVESLTGSTSNNQVIIRDYSSSPINTNGIKVETTLSPSWISWYEIELFDGILPIELIDFDAKNTEGGVSLNWSTASEINNLGFEIQKSIDGRDWQMIEFVNGEGTTTEINQYEFQDTNPSSGVNYYRLKQIDFDEAFEYSNVIAVEYNNSERNIKVFPNPSNRLINIQIDNPSGQRMKVNITDNLGRKIWESEMVNGESNWRKELDIDGNGIYFVTAQIGDEVYYERVILLDEK